MSIVAIRGATTVKEDQPEEIRAACLEMVQELLSKNGIKSEQDIVMIFLTMTSDIQSLNASSAIRQGMGWKHVPFFTSQEPEIKGMLPRCIRILVQANLELNQAELKHIYLNEATKLRPDLVS